MRENYRKCLKKRQLKTRSGSGSSQKLPTCHFFKELQFLTDTLRNKPSESNIAISAKPVNKSVDKENIPLQKENAPSQINNDEVVLRPRVAKRKVEEKFAQPQEQPRLLDVAIIETLKSSKKTEDEPNEKKDSNLLFCLSLVDTLKSLSSRDNALVKLKIQQILFEVQHGDQH